MWNQSIWKMKIVEAFKLLSSLFTSENFYFKIHNDTVNRETVSLNTFIENNRARTILKSLSVLVIAIRWMQSFQFSNNDSMFRGMFGRYTWNKWNLWPWTKLIRHRRQSRTTPIQKFAMEWLLPVNYDSTGYTILPMHDTIFMQRYG